MALQGQLRDFSATEILQLLGSQKKTGCVTFEQGGERRVVHVIDGRIVSTRMPGLAKDDPLLAFLRVTHRLSDEQLRGIATIQRESGRDLEDLLLNGRYLSEDELTLALERQILDDIMGVARWTDGSYEFDPHARWTQRPLMRLGIEGVIMEAARRADERKRYDERLGDPQAVLGLRDLPDPSESLTEEERELFGIVDGRRTLAEVLEAAPLTDFEGREALHRLLESGWIEVVGRRDPATVPAPPREPSRSEVPRPHWQRELAVGGCLVAAMVVLRLLAHVAFAAPPAVVSDVFVESRVRDVRYALALYHREHGTFPARLEQLTDDRWLAPRQLTPGAGMLRYRATPDGSDCSLVFQPDR